MSQVQPLPVHWVHRALAMRGKSVQKHAVFSCFETFSILLSLSNLSKQLWDLRHLETFCIFLHLFVEAGFVRVLFVCARLMHLLHQARRLRFWLELTRVKRCVIIVITIGSLTVQPTSRGQGGCAFRTNCKWCTCTTDARFSWMLLHHWMLLGIPIIASGNMTLESGLRDCVLGSSWFIISAFVHHFCKQNGVDARLDSKHSPGQAECWKPRESVKSYRCSKKIHSRKRISLQLPTYEIDLNWLLSDLLIYLSASYILVYEIQIYTVPTVPEFLHFRSRISMLHLFRPKEALPDGSWWFIARRHLQADPIRCTWHRLVKSFDANISLRTYGIHMGPHMSYFAYLSHVWFR